MQETLQETLQEFEERLKTRLLYMVAEDTKITYQTLKNIVDGRLTNPTIRTMSALIQYFKDNK